MQRLNRGREAPPGPTRVLVIRNADTGFVYFPTLDGSLPGVPAQDALGRPTDFSRSASLTGADEIALTGQGAYDPVLGTTRYPFRHGDTTINVWSFGQAVPANKSSAGIQYVISNVEAVDAKAKAAAVTIDRPLGPFGTGLRTIWLSDPDGVTNYFAQIMRRAPAAVPATQ